MVGPPAVAAQFEKAPAFNAAEIPHVAPVGPNYTIETPVQSNGLLRDYILKTPYGEMWVRGDEMLRMRLHELHTVLLLEKVSKSDTFAKALAQAGLNPLKYTGNLIVHPLGTIKNTLAGVGAMFSRVGAGIANAGQTPDKPLAGILGVTGERRTLAAAYGVDPYTDFPPLDAELKQLSQAAALGGLTVTGALIAVPGAAGIVASNLSTANKLNDVGIDELARKYTAAQILDLNRRRLAAMGVPPKLANRLLGNPNYTPIDMATMVAALDSMPKVKDRALFVTRAADAGARYAAYFMRRRAELLAADYRRNGGYVRFVSLSGYPFIATRDGRIELLAPVDALSWTREVAGGFAEVTDARNREFPKARGELRITDTATPLAKRQLKAEGWSLRENQ
jgi:hypothetical protein